MVEATSVIRVWVIRTIAPEGASARLDPQVNQGGGDIRTRQAHQMRLARAQIGFFIKAPFQ
jgi:hypothetical protein